MNGSSRKRVEISALQRAEGRARSSTASSVGMMPQPAVDHHRRGQHARRPSSAPTERSMPAVMMTKVMPSAMIPVSETARTMLAMLSGARNRICAVPARREDDAADQHQHEADQALEADDNRPAGRARLAGAPVAGPATGWLGSCRLLLAVGGCQHGAPRRRRPANSATLRPCRAAPRCGRTARSAPASRSTRPARPGPGRRARAAAA